MTTETKTQTAQWSNAKKWDWRDDLWQEVEDCAYIIDGESMQRKFEALLGLRDYLKEEMKRPDFTTNYPEGNTSDWALYAVHHLVDSLTQHIDPEYLRVRDAILKPLAQQLTELAEAESRPKGQDN